MVMSGASVRNIGQVKTKNNYVHSQKYFLDQGIQKNALFYSEHRSTGDVYSQHLSTHRGALMS